MCIVLTRMILLVLLVSQADSALAAEPGPDRPRWPIFPHKFTFTERGDVWGGSVVLGTNRFCFLPPPKSLQSLDAKLHKVTISASDYSVVLSFRLWEKNLPPALWQQNALSQYPEGKLVREVRCSAADSDGKAFDVLRTFPKQTSLMTRVGFVPFDGGTIEFQMTTAEDKFAKYHRVFGSFLSDFLIIPEPLPKPVQK